MKIFLFQNQTNTCSACSLLEEGRLGTLCRKAEQSRGSVVGRHGEAGAEEQQGPDNSRVWLAEQPLYFIQFSSQICGCLFSFYFSPYGLNR